MALLDTFTPDNLFAGNVMPVVSEEMVITGGNFVRGTVLGRISTSGKGTKIDSAASDGSQSIYAILAESTDASLEDKVAPVYLTGEFNSKALVFGGSDTAEDHKAEARKIGIFFK